MTKTEKEFVAQLNSTMPKFTGTPTEIEKKIAMYIYLKIGESKAFDEKWFLGNKKQKEKIEKLAKRERNNIDSLIKKRKLVCITIASLYSKISNDFGINCKVIQPDENDLHCSDLITLQNGEQMVVDLQRDLYRINTKSKMKHFGQKYENGDITQETISDEELLQLHKACGYVHSEDEYMDTKISQLAKKVKDMEPPQILEQIITDENINKYPKDIGYIELYKFYTRVVHEVAPKLDKVKIHYCNCYRVVQGENGEDEKEYSMCIYSFYKDKVKAYIYSNTERKFKPIDLETFDKLEKEGLFIGKNPQEKGVKLLRKYINKAIEESNEEKIFEKS